MVTSEDTAILRGSPTSTVPSPRRCARSASSRSASRGPAGHQLRPGRRIVPGRGDRPERVAAALGALERADRLAAPVRPPRGRPGSAAPASARGHRPGRRRGLGQCRVAGIRLGLGGPVRQPPGAGLARGADLVEEPRRPEPRRAVRPPVARAAEPVRGPGRGDVRQPPLLGQVPGRAGRSERGQVRVRPGAASPGRSAASPRSLNGSSRGVVGPRVVDTRGLAGKTWRCGPPARPGTKTAAHCRPLAACTVASFTESVSPTWPASRPNSSVSAAAR